jgi:hypothetical protein
MIPVRGSSTASLLRHQQINNRAEPAQVDALALVTVAVIAVLCGMAVGLLTLWVRTEPSQNIDMVRMNVSGSKLSVPASWVTNAHGTGQIVERLELVVPVSDLGIEGVKGAKLALNVTGADNTMHPAERPSQLYARFVSSEYAAGPAGLIKRQFKNEAAFQGETLYLSAPDGRIFSARCQEQDTIRPICFSEFRIGGLDLRASYTLETLPYWSSMTDALTQRLASADLKM